MTHKLRRKLPKITALSPYCIILAIICQAFSPFSAVFAKSSTNPNNFYFQDFSADYYLGKNSDSTSYLKVEEELTAVFPNSDQNHGITRDIYYTNQNGKNLTMPSPDHLDIAVLHNGLVEEPYDIESHEGFFRVYIGDPNDYVQGTQTYKLSYEFKNVITEFTEDGETWQELYWDTNGTGWSQKFSNLSARVHFADDIAHQATNQAWCYVGTYGENGSDRCNLNPITDGFEFTTTNLSPHENLTFVTTFKPDTFTMPAKQYDFRYLITFVIELVSAAIMIIWTITLKHRVDEKRRFYKDYFIKPEYMHPRDFTVAEMSKNYIGSSSNDFSRQATATLIDMAISHKITLIKGESKTKLGKPKTNWSIRIEQTNLTANEHEILQILTGDTKLQLEKGATFTIKHSSSDDKLIHLKNKIRNRLQETLISKGLLEKKWQKNSIILLTVISFLWLTVFLMLAPILLSTSSASYRILVGQAILMPAIIVIAFLVFGYCLCTAISLSSLASHTIKGLEYSRYLDGLKLYIKMAEADRMKLLQSVQGADITHQGIVKLHEKLLPYAIIFNFEKSWLGELGKYYEFQDVESPSWYIGMGAFSAHEFASAIESMSSYTTGAVAGATSVGNSSSSSGSGGGGFSGGGGGGGGGGGW